MKKYFLILFVLFATLRLSSQISFVGFDQTFCPDPMTNVYTYTNYSGPTPSSPRGFKTYLNGVLVSDVGGSFSAGCYCLDMKFVNDSTGFAVAVYGMATVVFKTSNFGFTWTGIGSVPPVGYAGVYPGYWGLYVVNPNYAYLVTGITSDSTIYVCRASDIDYSWTFTNQFILDDSVSADIYKTDTIYGNSLCNIDSLNIFVKNPAGDTIDYHINIFSIPLGINELSSTSNPYIVYPNPSINDITIEGENFASAEIYSLDGKQIFRSASKTINTETLSKGLYFLKITNHSGLVFNSKFIKE